MPKPIGRLKGRDFLWSFPEPRINRILTLTVRRDQRRPATATEIAVLMR
jgi:hypothetical protein